MSLLQPGLNRTSQTVTMRTLRNWLQGALAGPFQTFSPAISPTTAGGAHGVVGWNDLKVSAQASPDLTVKVSAGRGFITGSSNNAIGVYPVFNDGDTNVTITPDATNPRINLVCVQQRDNVEDAGGADDVRFFEVAGTPAASPSAPSTVPNSLVLCEIAVPAASGSITDGMITDRRRFATALGGLQIGHVPTGVALDTQRMWWDNGRLWVRDHVSGENRIVAGNMPRFSVTRTATGNFSSGVGAQVNLGANHTELVDTDGFMTASAIVTIPAGMGGDYQLDAGLQWAANNTGFRRIQLAITPSTAAEMTFIGQDSAASINTTFRQAVGKMFRLDAGATIEMSARQDSGGGLPLDAAWLSLHMVSHIPSLT